jgi:hypothetical protein
MNGSFSSGARGANYTGSGRNSFGGDDGGSGGGGSAIVCHCGDDAQQLTVRKKGPNTGV